MSTTAAYEVPLSSAAQTFQITILQVVYTMQVVWNSQNQSWVLDIADQNNDPLVQGLPLITGAGLLDQFGYLDLGFNLECQTDHDITAPPTYANLGTTGHLYVLVPSS